MHTVEYSYDAISCLLEARYNPGVNIAAADADLLRRYQYSHDLAGNRLSESQAIAGGAPTVTNYTSYNDANQISIAGFTYDNNGNLTNDGTDAYTWDRANRLLTAPASHSYAYDGDGRRIQKTVSSTVTDYLLDVQPGLSVVLAATTGASTERYVHGPRGIHAQEDNAGVWTYPVQDGLGSVRQEASVTPAVNGMQNLDPYGNLYGQQGTINIPFAFTGELRDGNDLQHHRARHFNPAIGAWLSLDPFEGVMNRPLSLNGYSWVEGNTPNMVDPSGECMAQDLCDLVYIPLFCDIDISAQSPTPSTTPLPPNASHCPRMPNSGFVYSWEKDLLAVAALSEIKGLESVVNTEDFQAVSYALAYVILNRITSPCATGAMGNITRIHQAAFSGVAIRNVGVYGNSALLDTAMSQFVIEGTNSQGDKINYVANYMGISEDAAYDYTQYVINTRIPSTAGLTRSPDEAAGLSKVRQPVNRALNEWCSGQDGPGVAKNAIFYATAINKPGYENPMTEIYNQLGALEVLQDGSSCGCQFGWAGSDIDEASVRAIVACNFTLQVDLPEFATDRQRYIAQRQRGEELAPQLRITYP